MHIFTNNLSIYLINNHIHHPTSQHQHPPNTLLIASIVCQIYWTPHTVHIHKVQAHSRITRNEITDTLANDGTLVEKTTATPHIHTTHTTPYWLASYLMATHDGAICNLHKLVTKEHKNREIETTKTKLPYMDKWLSNT